MSNLQLFGFEDKSIRFVGSAERPEWIAQDICDVLENGKASNALRDFDEDEKGMYSVHTPGGEQDVLTVLEPGLYRLLSKSRKPVGKRFQRWMFHEVLPSIRKTGKYEIKESPLHAVPSRDEAIADMKFMEAAADMLISAGLDPLLTKGHVLSQTARLHPALAPQIEAVKLLIPQQSQLQSDEIYLNPTEIGKRCEPPISPRRVNLLLTGLGLQRRTGMKDPAYELTEKGKKYGKVTLNQAKASDKTVQHIKWLATVTELLKAA